MCDITPPASRGCLSPRYVLPQCGGALRPYAHVTSSNCGRCETRSRPRRVAGTLAGRHVDCDRRRCVAPVEFLAVLVGPWVGRNLHDYSHTDVISANFGSVIVGAVSLRRHQITGWPLYALIVLYFVVSAVLYADPRFASSCQPALVVLLGVGVAALIRGVVRPQGAHARRIPLAP
jgi:hypothetical protein